jgi:hypothetical protein
MLTKTLEIFQFQLLYVYKEPMRIEAKKLIDESGLNVHSAVLLQEAADLVGKVLN